MQGWVVLAVVASQLSTTWAITAASTSSLLVASAVFVVGGVALQLGGRRLGSSAPGRALALSVAVFVAEAAMIGVLVDDGARIAAVGCLVGAALAAAVGIASAARVVPAVVLVGGGGAFLAIGLAVSRTQGTIPTMPLAVVLVVAVLAAIVVDVVRVRAFHGFSAALDLARSHELDDDVHLAMERLVTLARERRLQRGRDVKERAEAARARGRVYAGISHELKSPLNAVLGFADLAASLDPTAPQRESLDIVARKARSLVALIEALLDVARVETRELTLRLTELSTAVLLDEIVMRARELSEGRAAIRVELLSPAEPIVLDPTYFPRAIGLFAAHAAETLADGETETPVRVTALVDAGILRITVEHPVRGLSPEGLMRLVADERRPDAGLALGLRGAKAIVELHGGKTTAAFSSSGGAVLRCEIPVSGK